MSKTALVDALKHFDLDQARAILKKRPADIIPDLVRHGADLNEVVGATPLHRAVDVVQRGVDGKPQLGCRRLTCAKEMLRLAPIRTPDA